MTVDYPAKKVNFKLILRYRILKKQGVLYNGM